MGSSRWGEVTTRGQQAGRLSDADKQARRLRYSFPRPRAARLGMLPAGSLCASAPPCETTGVLVNLMNHAAA